MGWPWRKPPKLYANGHDLRDPQLSPIYWRLVRFSPPTILTSGTRGPVPVQYGARASEAPSGRRRRPTSNVFEGQSHAQYAGDPDAPETKGALWRV